MEKEETLHSAKGQHLLTQTWVCALRKRKRAKNTVIFIWSGSIVAFSTRKGLFLLVLSHWALLLFNSIEFYSESCLFIRTKRDIFYFNSMVNHFGKESAQCRGGSLALNETRAHKVSLGRGHDVNASRSHWAHKTSQHLSPLYSKSLLSIQRGSGQPIV